MITNTYKPRYADGTIFKVIQPTSVRAYTFISEHPNYRKFDEDDICYLATYEKDGEVKETRISCDQIRNWIYDPRVGYGVEIIEPEHGE